MVLNSTLLAPSNDYRVPGRVGLRNNYLSLLVEEGHNMEFGKPGKALICSGKVSGVFFNEEGNLNPAGLELVCNGVENKFRCG